MLTVVRGMFYTQEGSRFVAFFPLFSVYSNPFPFPLFHTCKVSLMEESTKLTKTHVSLDRNCNVCVKNMRVFLH